MQGNFNIPPDNMVMVANLQKPDRFDNITAAYTNNYFQFSLPTASSTYATYTIVIPV